MKTKNLFLSTISATDEEVLKYGSLEQVRERFEAVLDERDGAQAEVKLLERREERLQEQLCFAVELIDSIEEACKQLTVAKELKAAIARAIENSYFER